MLRSIRFQLTRNAVAWVALFVALGGTSYAVATGSIGSKELANNSIKSKDVHKNAIRGKDVKEKTFSKVNSAKLADSAKVADEALAIGGKSAVCPPGTGEFLGQCFEFAPRAPVNFLVSAHQDCEDEGRYLPTLLQLRAFVMRPDVALGAGGEYSNDVYEDFVDESTSSTRVMLAVTENGGVDSDVLGGPDVPDRSYRCVAPLLG